MIDVVKLAREAGWSGFFMVHMSELGSEGFPIPKTKEELERFAALIVEKCARTVEGIGDEPGSYGSDYGTVEEAVKRIRNLVYKTSASPEKYDETGGAIVKVYNPPSEAKNCVFKKLGE